MPNKLGGFLGALALFGGGCFMMGHYSEAYNAQKTAKLAYNAGYVAALDMEIDGPPSLKQSYLKSDAIQIPLSCDPNDRTWDYDTCFNAMKGKERE